jgi:hypothetical protein
VNRVIKAKNQNSNGRCSLALKYLSNHEEEDYEKTHKKAKLLLVKLFIMAWADKSTLERGESTA